MVQSCTFAFSNADIVNHSPFKAVSNTRPPGVMKLEINVSVNFGLHSYIQGMDINLTVHVTWHNSFRRSVILLGMTTWQDRPVQADARMVPHWSIHPRQLETKGCDKRLARMAK